jgi:hypothetical protein
MNKSSKRGEFLFYGYAGGLLIIFSGIGLFLHWWFFRIFMTPLCWTGLILFLDALNYRLSGRSLIKNRLREFLWMIPWSVALWYFFEFYNLFIHNWHYIGLPVNKIIRYAGYFWSFATIWPGVYEIFDLVKNLNIFTRVKVKPVNLTQPKLFISFIFGSICMLLPFFVPRDIARFLAAPVWIGMVFLLDPLNFMWKRHSFWRDWAQGDLSMLFQLFLTGIIAGLLWEFWNYWATAKWIYTVPILGQVKLFEMPVVGYLGFPAFAVEVSVLWETVKHFLKFE